MPPPVQPPQPSLSISNIKENEIAIVASSSSPPTIQNSTSPTSSLAAPPEPRFSYVDIQLPGNAALQTHITISPNIVLFQSQPQVRLTTSDYNIAIYPFYLPTLPI